MNNLKVFTAFYDVNAACQCHPEYDTRFRVVVAATEEQALGFVLDTDCGTAASDWSIHKVETDLPSVNDESANVLRRFG